MRRPEALTQFLLMPVGLAAFLPLVCCDLPLTMLLSARQYWLSLFFAGAVGLGDFAHHVFFFQRWLFVPIFQKSILHSLARFKYQFAMTFTNQLNSTLRLHVTSNLLG